MSTISSFTPVIQSPVVTPASPRNIHPNPFARCQTIGTSGEIARETTTFLTCKLFVNALSKYLTVIGEEIRAPPFVVQTSVKATDHPVN
ncbi:5392_t:CDS:2 [Ambispora gerdemannii]|uniref:5392_t:CDS:1 n=1 Tax=Ambispora gerdemannii TaxID=144530 RepID=A0A9N9H198_9GLOM|nr:5392_t:CDS:2 [Ambispora gerdemannii]